MGYYSGTGERELRWTSVSKYRWVLILEWVWGERADVLHVIREDAFNSDPIIRKTKMAETPHQARIKKFRPL